MNKQWLLREPGAADPTGGAAEVFGGDEGQPGGVDQTSTTNSGATTPPAQASPGLSKDDVAEILRKANVGQAPPQPATPQQQNISEEDFNKMFNVHRADEKFLRDLLGLDPETQVAPERLAAFNQYGQALVRQAVTMAAFQIDAIKQELTKQMSPAVTFAQQQEHERLKTEFFKTNEDLKPYEPLVTEVYQRLAASGWKGSKEEAFKTIADNARTILKQLPGDLLSQQSSPESQTKAPKPAHKMSTVSSGGQGGAGGAKAPKSGPAAIFG